MRKHGSERVVRSIMLWNKYCGTPRGNEEKQRKQTYS